MSSENNAQLHYGGMVYNIAGGKEQATALSSMLMTYIRAGGGVATVDTGAGVMNFNVGANIPFAILFPSDAAA